MEHSKMKSNRNRNYEKPQWEVEKERLEKEKREAIERGMKDTEENFPSLGGGMSKTTSVWSGRKFVELASDWKANDDARKAALESGKTVDTPKMEQFVMPQFNPSRHYVEADDETPLPSADAPKFEEEENVWTTVDRSAKSDARRVRKQKRIEERLRRLDDGEESESETEEEDEEDSCWNSHITGTPLKKSSGA